MFVLISMLISIGILAVLLYLSKQRQNSLQRKYELLVDLRQLLHQCRQHRSATHLGLTSEHNPKSELSHLQDALMETSNHLIATAQFENKPMYRILQLKLKALDKEWSDRSVARNQMIHGKTIRHCLFLMDEIAMAWLAESGRDDLSDEYHLNWQQVVDSMEVLTQLRISIQDMHTEDGALRVKYYCDKMRRKLNQLALISPLSIASPGCSKAMHMLGELTDNPAYDISVEQLYAMTSDVSLSIANVYDQMLSELTETLYLPLPKVAIAA
ncbi:MULTISPECIES: hypothetical protein [unclassified Vibrio]|uniref:hypothetical protein n=1 Tax=unclassified Vibrio TaxID=2614977 RepID=UPI001361627E|nr:MULTISPECIES: hypothetical protein [unclassified Vibrio]NAW56789.1 hypothetical protein [Vibrio sp. V36_P2S2PM302]NAX23035.1 hypothetical protein [Vibrio sp. V39_P1S14PM300]NAX24110.1 hypothetical protein [Vibrio sp. V38_P2S17PM301]NAX30521.1 hypothetical protein [Vibrio sp. V37_P2S8PM304]